MQTHAEATPCPASRPTFGASSENNPYTRLSATNPCIHDDTSNVQYTTELQLHQKHVKPRRRPGAQRRTTFNPSVDIYDDAEKDDGQNHPTETGKAMAATGSRSRQSIISAQSARKLPGESSMSEQSSVVRPRRKRVSQILAERQNTTAEQTLDDNEPYLQQDDGRLEGLRKNPRRRTIYVPSEDTTIMTIHPGAPSCKCAEGRPKSSRLGLDRVKPPGLELDAPVPSTSTEPKRASRKSLAAAPRRGPLQQTTRALQDVLFLEDVVGTGGGKENLPPGKLLGAPVESKVVSHISRRNKPTKTLRTNCHNGVNAEEITSKSIRAISAATRPSAISPTAASRAKTAECRKRNGSGGTSNSFPAKSLKAAVNSTARKEGLKCASREPLASDSVSQTYAPTHARQPSPRVVLQQAEKVPFKIKFPSIYQAPKSQHEKYSVLTEDLSRPELYENEWLSYQEIAMTQLLNGLLDVMGEKNGAVDQPPGDLRKQLLALYQQADVPLLYKRLQASLLYGALAVPKNTLAQALRLKDDIGLRRKFLNLWLDTYESSALKAAAETVVGREIGRAARLSSTSSTPETVDRQTRAERRSIEAFLVTFLVNNEDAVRPKTGAGSITSVERGEPTDDEVGSHAWAWRKTVLRSLMLIHLLDRAKASDIVPFCLFQAPSPHKSSASVLQALSSMLLPSMGDVIRPLGHLTYHVQSVQYPLEEYMYHIDNLATGLRDGVLLTRLVEVLLYPPPQLASQTCGDTISVTLPTGNVLTSVSVANKKELWVLSQHLKYPCVSRAQKLYNVQIALSALEGVKGVAGRVVEGIRADDIVDGHREKTLGLLWGLVSRCGLDRLVDFKELEKEIQRFRETWHTQHPNEGPDTDDEEPTDTPSGLALHTSLLHTWARTIGRLHGLRITNLTTSFASGAALSAIVDAYLPYFHGAAAPSTAPTAPASVALATKLASIGCSAAFTSVYTPSTAPAQPLPSRDFTITALAFLAARLVPAARAHRAARTIQRAYRRRLRAREASRRVAAMRLAAHCAAVVRMRARVVGAAVVLQQAWRAVLERRIAMLVADVMGVQCVARGWVARGRVWGRRAERVRAGW